MQKKISVLRLKRIARLTKKVNKLMDKEIAKLKNND